MPKREVVPQQGTNEQSKEFLNMQKDEVRRSNGAVTPEIRKELTKIYKDLDPKSKH